LYENVPKTVAERAVETASELNISSWDGYLMELARELKISKIYSVDEELKDKIKNVQVVNPTPK